MRTTLTLLLLAVVVSARADDPPTDATAQIRPGLRMQLVPPPAPKPSSDDPPRQRDAIIQSKTEGFPPGYESLLQSYYQRLAQEKVGGDEQPTTRPASR